MTSLYIVMYDDLHFVICFREVCVVILLLRTQEAVMEADITRTMEGVTVVDTTTRDMGELEMVIREDIAMVCSIFIFHSKHLSIVL